MKREMGQEKCPETVVSGSFRKHMEQIGKVLGGFERSGVRVLAPTTKDTSGSKGKGEFVVLVTDDPSKPPHKLEIEFLREIGKAYFLYVADVGGYVGQSAATEMAYARLKDLPVVLAEAIQNFSADVPEDARELLRGLPATTLPIDGINGSEIERIKKWLKDFKYADISQEQKQILVSLIKKLISDLRLLKL